MRLDEISQFKREELAHELRHEDEWNRRQAAGRSRRPFRPGPRKVRQYLNVPYREKDEAKRQGARWDPQAKKWYVEVFPGQSWEPAGYEHWWSK